MKLRTFFLLLACGLMLGCSGGDDGDDGGVIDASDPPTTDAPVGGNPDAPEATPDAMGPTPDAAPVVCNMLNNTAPTITVRRSMQTLPTPTGGSIQDGTFHLTSDVFYNAPMDVDLGQAQATAVYAGTTVQLTTSQDGAKPVLSTSTFQTAGQNDISYFQSCPDELDLRWDKYSAGGGTIELHYTAASRVQTFTLQ